MQGDGLYRNFKNQEEIDAQYNLALNVADAAGWMNGWLTRSTDFIRQASNAHLDVRYGPTKAEYIDVFAAGQNAPVHIFIHGGYWRRFSARDHAFLASGINDAGLCAVIVNYELCPKVTIDEITRQVRAAIAWCYRNIHRFGGDPERMSISGHSAGGHLTAMACLTAWERDYGLPQNLIKAAMPVSGLFDLRPLPYSYLQPSLQLSWQQILTNSPIEHAAPDAVPMHIIVGGDETEEFQRQSRALAERWGVSNPSINVDAITGRHHFSILDDYLDASTSIRRWLEARR